MSVFKIKDKVTGQYSQGGIYYAAWSKHGKAWNSRNAVMNHISQMFKYNRQAAEQYKNAIIVHFEEVELGPYAETVLKAAEGLIQRRKEREAAADARYEAEAKKRRHEQWQKLNSEFGRKSECTGGVGPGSCGNCYKCSPGGMG